MQTLTQTRTESKAGPRHIGRPTGALARLLAITQAPVIGVAGTGQLDVTMELMADMLRAGGRKVARGMAEALTMAGSLGKDDRIVVEITPPLMRQVPHGLSTLVIAGLAPDDLAPGQAMAEAVDGMRRAIAGAGDAIVVNADDARALALAAEARVEVFRVAAADRSADASIRAGELVVIDPVLGVERRVCRLTDSAAAAPAYRSGLLLAAAVAAAAGVEVDALRAVAQAFEPGPGQMETLPTEDRLRWINDAAASRPGRAALALESVGGVQDAILVAGGRYGGQALERWAQAASATAEHVLVFGSGAPALVAALQQRGGPIVVRCADLADAVLSAERLARSGQTILFAPACEPDELEPPSPVERFRSLVLQTTAAGDEREAA